MNSGLYGDLNALEFLKIINVCRYTRWSMSQPLERINPKHHNCFFLFFFPQTLHLERWVDMEVKRKTFSQDDLSCFCRSQKRKGTFIFTSTQYIKVELKSNGRVPGVTLDRCLVSMRDRLPHIPAFTFQWSRNERKLELEKQILDAVYGISESF